MSDLYGLIAKIGFPIVLFILIILMFGQAYLINDINWHKEAVFRYQGYWQGNISLLEEYNTQLQNSVADLNTQIEVCKVALIYEKERFGERK